MLTVERAAVAMAGDDDDSDGSVRVGHSVFAFAYAVLVRADRSQKVGRARASEEKAGSGQVARKGEFYSRKVWPMDCHVQLAVRPLVERVAPGFGSPPLSCAPKVPVRTRARKKEKKVSSCQIHMP